jgi:hypothetical protein
VYPGYIRTPIHQASADEGIALEGAVPVEKVEKAAAAIVRAALGKPVRDLATTRRGGIAYAALRRLPRGLVDRGMREQMRRRVKAGAFDESRLASDFVARMRGSG